MQCKQTLPVASALVLWLVHTPLLAEIPDASVDCEVGMPESTPSSEFMALEAGSVVRHERTGLEWQRCPVGMTWDSGTQVCNGIISDVSWEQALSVAEDEGNGWRVPNIKELGSIVEYCRADPAINKSVFPDTPTSSSNSFWSASHAGDASPGSVRTVYPNGNIANSTKGGANWVRLVRDSR